MVFQYLKDTRSELNHVAWPTRVQTIVYAILVILVSVLISLYLGFFDFLFTRGLAKVVEMVPQSSPLQVEQTPATTSTSPDLKISTSTVR